MGLFRLAARVGRWRDGAIRPVEEWSPIPRFREGGQNPAYRPSGASFYSHWRTVVSPGTHGAIWQARRDPTTGAFRDGARMARNRARRRGCGPATATAATRPEIALRPKHRTARNAGTS